MTNFLGSQSKAGKARPSPATALRIQSSVEGQPRPFGWGQSRIAGNAIWAGNFYATLVQQQSGGGGKGGIGGGGGKGGASGGTYNYSTGIAFGLGEGPLDSVIQAWQNKSPLTMSPQSAKTSGTDPTGADFTFFDGDYQQLPWPWLQSFQSSAAQAFRGLAYEADSSLFLGNSPELPNMTWEVRYAISGAISEVFTVPGTPFKVTAQYFDWDYGLVGRYTVPYSAPFAVTPVENVSVESGAATAIEQDTSLWHGSNSSGVIWDIGASNGTAAQPLTRVSGTPATGQYSVSGNNFTFAAADAGQPIVVITAALAPGVYYATQAAADLVAGSTIAANVATSTARALGARLSAQGYLAEGTFVAAVTGGSASGNTASGSGTVSNVSGKYAAVPGTPIADSKGAIAPGTTVVSTTAASVTAGTTSALTATGVTFASVYEPTGTQADNQITNLSGTAGIVAGSSVEVWNADFGAYVVATVTGVSGTTATLDQHTGYFGGKTSYAFSTQFTGDVTSGSAVIANPSNLAGISTASVFNDSAGAFPFVTAITAATPGTITLSANATASATGDSFSFATQAVLSAPAAKSGTGVTITARGAPLTQVLSSPAAGEFSVSVQAGSFGQYTFSSADAGAMMMIVDSPDANPADVLVDFLTNPYYGMTQFPPALIGDLSAYRTYCQASGLVVSPIVTSQGAANQFLQDLMTATNSEIVWSAGKLTVAPYGDQAVTANGTTFAPSLAPLYSIDDDDLQKNEATNASSAASVSSGDPVTVTRLDLADQANDIKVEYLDRANAYNPAIVEAKDDAAIATFGVKNSGTSQLHLFCTQKAALAAAQLMLGRANVRRSFSFTLGREFILLDPMDLVEITDASAGLVDQLVRIKEITENDDRTLSITAEEVLDGTGSAPLYGHQSSQGFVPNYNVAAPAVLVPIFFDAPVQIGNVLGMETMLCTNGARPNWGGCDIWIGTDNVNFKFAGTLWGGTTMGSVTASFPTGLDPDTVNTLSVDLTATQGILNGGTQADADQGNTLCLVDQELVSYEQATLTSQCHYDLGKHGASAGYLRRGVYGTTIASHSAGAPFARLRPGSYFTIGYGAADVGTTVYVKLLSFNPHGGGKQTLDQVSSYSHALAAPPALSSGLLPGLIQTPDIAINAATAQLTVSAAGPISLPVAPSNATLVSGALTTEGNLVQIAYNAQFTNSGSNAETAIWRVTYQGVNVLDSASILIQPGGTATIAKQTTFSAPSQSGVFAMIAQGATSTDNHLTASFVDLSVTELRR